MPTHKILLSPAERWQLVMLTHPKDGEIPNGQEGRKYRRFQRALGLDVVARVVRQHGSVLLTPSRDESTRQLFVLEDEHIEFAADLSKRPRGALAEDVLGDFFDRIDNMRAGRPVDDVNGPAYAGDDEEKKWLPEQSDATE